MARLIGLDIGSTTIKVVELEQGEKSRLTALGLTPTPPKGLFSEAAMDQQALAEAIKKVCIEAKVTTKAVNIALPENVVFTRLIEMPKLSEKELASAIHWEAEQYIPLPLSEVNLDYQVIEDEAGGQNMQVFLVASQKKIVSKYQKIIAASGLELVSIETQSLALNRALLDNSSTAPVALVINMGDSTTNIFIAKKGKLIFTYVIPTGGKALTRALSSDLAMDPAQAEEYKKTYGLKKEDLSGKVGKGLMPLIDNIIAELKKAISFYQSKGPQVEPLRRAVLVGGSAKLPGLVVYLTESLGMETQIGDPWLKIADVQKVKSQPFDPILFAEAVGLALKPL